MPVLRKAPDCRVDSPKINIAPIVGDAQWPRNAQHEPSHIQVHMQDTHAPARKTTFNVRAFTSLL
jgi:hypothetical protein